MSNSSFKSTLEPALLYGAIVGGVGILHSIVLYAMDASFSTFSQFSGVILPILTLTYVLYLYRKEQMGGIVSYSQSLGMGALIMVVAGVISAIYTYIHIKYIDTDFLNAMGRMQEEQMLEKGLDEAAIEQAMEFTSKMRSTGVFVFTAFFGSAFMGVIYSAIISIFLKKAPADPFASVE